MPPRKRNRPDKTPSPPEHQPNPAKKAPKQLVTLTPAPQPKLPSLKPPPQNPPTSRQSTSLDASDYATYPTSYTQGLHAGGLSGAGPGYGEPLDPNYRPLYPEFNEPRHPSIVNQQRPLLPSPYAPNPTQVPPSQPGQNQMSSQPFQSQQNPSDSQPASGLPVAGPWRPEEDVALTNIKQEKGVSFERVSRLMSVAHFNRSPDECKTRWSKIGKQRLSVAWSEVEDEELIRARVRHPSYTQGMWPFVSRVLVAKGFNHDYRSCERRWQTVKPQTEPRRWSEAEDRELTTLTEAYTNKATSNYWEPISQAMEAKGFDVTVVHCRDRYYRQRVPGYGSLT